MDVVAHTGIDVMQYQPSVGTGHKKLNVLMLYVDIQESDEEG